MTNSEVQEKLWQFDAAQESARILLFQWWEENNEKLGGSEDYDKAWDAMANLSDLRKFMVSHSPVISNAERRAFEALRKVFELNQK